MSLERAAAGRRAAGRLHAGSPVASAGSRRRADGGRRADRCRAERRRLDRRRRRRGELLPRQDHPPAGRHGRRRLLRRGGPHHRAPSRPAHSGQSRRDRRQHARREQPRRANYMYRVGPKDGTLIQSFVGSLVVRQLFSAPGVEYDATRLHYLGAPATDAYVLIVTRKSGVTRVEDTFGPTGKPLVLGTLGPGSPLEVGPTLLRDFFGANLRLVSGYDGAAKIRLAIDGGEVDGTFTSWQEIRSTSREKFESGEWLVLSQASADPQPEIASIPSLLDLARDDQQRQLLRLATIVPYAFARPYVVAPEVPMERVRALETAFARTMADPEFLAEAERGQIFVEPVPPTASSSSSASSSPCRPPSATSSSRSCCRCRFAAPALYHRLLAGSDQGSHGAGV